MRVREKAFGLIRSVFKRHGAVEIDTPVFELKPGRSEVEVHDSGQLNISSEALLDRVMSVRYGVPVSTWRAQDNLFQLTTKNGVLRYRTPVGDYDVTMPDGSVERITLTKFQEVS